MLPVVAGTSRLTTLPGLRTLAAPRFRVVLGAVLLVTAVVLLSGLLLARASSPTGQFGIDATDYLTAAHRIAHGASPYAPEMLAGPVDSQGVDRYRYPPPLAQMLIPMTVLPDTLVLWAWLAIGVAAIAGSVLVALRSAHLLSLERALWSLAAACLFLPVFDSLWKGNVSGVVALLVAVAATGGAAGGAAVALATLLKVAPAAFVPAWWIVGAPSRRGMVLSTLAVVAASVLLSPSAWRDYLTVLPNMLAGSADEATNVAPWSMVARSGAPAWLGDLVRVLSVLVAVAATGISLPVIRRPAGLPLAAALCSVAMLLLPAALWYHYLVVLLPLAIVAWPRAHPRSRAGLVLSGAMVSAGVVWLPLATIGWVTLAAIIVGVLASPIRGNVPRPSLGPTVSI